MQKHQISTVFILVLIAALAVGSFVWLQKQYPHVAQEVKGDWENLASTDEVFERSAEPVETASADDYQYQGEVVPDSGRADDSAGSDDTAGAGDSFVYEDSGSGYDDSAYSADSYDESDYSDYDDADSSADGGTASDDGGDGSDNADGSGDAGDETAADDGAAEDGTGDGSDSDSTETAGSDDSGDSIDTYAYDDAGSDDSADEDYGDYDTPVEQPSDEDLYAHYADDSSTDSAGTDAAAPRERSHVEPIPQPSGKAPPAADTVWRWWPNAADVRRGQFALIFAGQPKGTDGIALLFSRQPSTDSLNANVSVVNDNGDVVSGSWAPSSGNPRMAIFRAAAGRRYVVLVGAGLTDAQGNAMGGKLSGPVYVR